MTSTVSLYGYTMGVLFAVMSVGFLTVERVISMTLQSCARHAGSLDDRYILQCSRPAAEDSHQTSEAWA